MPERYSRRSILKKGAAIPAALILSNIIPDTYQDEIIDLSDYKADVISHNAAINPTKFIHALESRAPHIEVDLTIIKDKLVVAHSPVEYNSLPEHQKAFQDPSLIFSEIEKAGKHPFLDLKGEITNLTPMYEYLERLNSDNLAMASSRNHGLLNALRQSRFEGKILFSIASNDALGSFLNGNKSNDFSGENFGVSIRHDLLWNARASNAIKDMGLSIAAWSPYNPRAIADSIRNGADFVTSDNLESLGKINPTTI